MWRAKFKVYDETGTFAGLAKKYKINIKGYMINHYKKGNCYYFILTFFLDCKEEIKHNIIEELSNKEIINRIEDQGNFLICELKISSKLEKEKKASLFYNPALIQVKPFIIGHDGWEELELASFERKTLEEVLKISEKKFKLKILIFKEQKIANFGVINLFPELTEKQKEILDLVIKEGYYSYPRKTNIKKLAKESSLSFSTFQEHLRKAENKLIPHLFRKPD